MPFTSAEFFTTLSAYNSAVGPLPLVLVLGTLFMTMSALRGHRGGVAIVYGGLALLWAWMGIVYHWVYFRPVNPSAVVWAVLFSLQAVLFLAQGLAPVRMVLPSRSAVWFGLSAIFYAILVYPLLGELFGHHYPARPTFGLPCPTTIATFGLLALLPVREPRWLPIEPSLWAVVGTLAMGFGMIEDISLAAFALGYWVLQWRERGSPFSQYFNPATPVTR